MPRPGQRRHQVLDRRDLVRPPSPGRSDSGCRTTHRDRRDLDRRVEVDAVEDDAGVGRRRTQGQGPCAAVQPDAGGADDGFQGALPDHGLFPLRSAFRACTPAAGRRSRRCIITQADVAARSQPVNGGTTQTGGDGPCGGSGVVAAARPRHPERSVGLLAQEGRDVERAHTRWRSSPRRWCGGRCASPPARPACRSRWSPSPRCRCRCCTTSSPAGCCGARRAETGGHHGDAQAVFHGCRRTRCRLDEAPSAAKACTVFIASRTSFIFSDGWR
jgi:hypothetical protein